MLEIAQTAEPAPQRQPAFPVPDQHLRNWQWP
jgi:hypothetical protein